MTARLIAFTSTARMKPGILKDIFYPDRFMLFRIVTCRVLAVSLFIASPLSAQESRAVQSQVPVVGDWWRVASNPDLGKWTSEQQEPVDFGIWQASDGTWQLWSCIRKTQHPGRTRVFHRWEGSHLTDKDWTPKGITFTGDGTIGETAGGMQAPHVIRVGDQYRMYYGDFRNICLATSDDGKSFTKVLFRDMAGLFGEGPRSQARDPMLIKIGSRWHCYYSAHPRSKRHPDGRHGIWMRTSDDLINFHDRRLVMTGGQAGDQWWNFECPHVIHRDGWFYLFHTQQYAAGRQQTSVYRSRDPGYFGIDDDRGFVCHLPVAAPEIIRHDEKWYIAALTEQLDGIRIAELTFDAPAK